MILLKKMNSLKLWSLQYARDKAQYNFVKARNDELERNWNFTEEQKNLYKYEYRIAQVISQTTEPSNSTIVIDLGSKDGVRPNMSVISVDGLVGVISKVSNFTSTVKLMTMMDTNDPNSQPPIAATALNKEGKSFGMIESYNPETNRLLMTKIPPGDPIAAKDTILSSGIGGLYPRGLTIGTVESVDVGEFGLTSTAVIKPSAEFQDWKQLIVVFTEERAE